MNWFPWQHFWPNILPVFSDLVSIPLIPAKYNAWKVKWESKLQYDVNKWCLNMFFLLKLWWLVLMSQIEWGCIITRGINLYWWNFRYFGKPPMKFVWLNDAFNLKVLSFFLKFSHDGDGLLHLCIVLLGLCSLFCTVPWMYSVKIYK